MLIECCLLLIKEEFNQINFQAGIYLHNCLRILHNDSTQF